MTRVLGKQGVQKDTTLGFRPPSPEDRAALEAGRAVFATLEEQAQALIEAQREMEAANSEIRFALATLEATRRDVARLHAALATAAGWIREIEGTETDEDGRIPLPLMPEDVEDALKVLVEITPIDVDAEPENAEPALEVICPECVQGKHPNCTEEVPVEDDEGKGRMVPCGCKVAGHVG